MKASAATILFALLLAGCAAPQPKPDPEIKRAQPKSVEIAIHTAPAGAIVDWNGNVLGTAPIVISLTPDFPPYSSH
jgi:PBP1b-binding outer membrane lipoprotein LpoB